MNESQVINTVTGKIVFIGTYEDCMDYTDGRCAVTYHIITYHGEPTIPIEKTKELENHFNKIFEEYQQIEPASKHYIDLDSYFSYFDKKIHEFFTCMLKGMSIEKKIKVLAKIIICFR